MSRAFGAETGDELMHGLAHHRPEHPVKVVAREVSDVGQVGQRQRLVEVSLDVVDHPVDPGDILGARVHSLTLRDRVTPRALQFLGSHA